MRKTRLGLLLIVVLSLAVAVGCVTTKRFEETISGVTTRVDNVQTKVEQNSGRIDKLEQRDVELSGDIQKVDGRVGEVRVATDQALAKAVDAEKAARGKVIWQVTLSNRDVRFGTDRYEVTESGRLALEELVAKVKALDRLVFIEVQGHTDSRGSEQYNEALGLKRAEAVRSQLRDHGIPLNLISAVSYGETKPVASNDTPEGRTANRRVEILVLE